MVRNQLFDMCSEVFERFAPYDEAWFLILEKGMIVHRCLLGLSYALESILLWTTEW